LENAAPAVTVQPASGEGCLYSSLTPQELKKLKEAILKTDTETFEGLVESNPRCEPLQEPI
jgi:hypothetical protein